jgi:hypothetical protein
MRSLRQDRVTLPFGRVPSARVSCRPAPCHRARPVADDRLLARRAVAIADRYAGRRASGDHGTGRQGAVVASRRAETDRVAHCRCSETDLPAGGITGRRKADEQAGSGVEHRCGQPAGRSSDVGGRIAGHRGLAVGWRGAPRDRTA